MPCPTNHGIATLATIATAASANDQTTPRRYGPRKPSSRLNVAIPDHPIVARATILAAMWIERATSAHGQAIAAIYDEAARTTPATFDLEGHEPDWWAGVIATNAYPFVVALDGDVVGFARAAQHKAKPAYGTTCETSVYVAQRARGRGHADALIEATAAVARRHAAPVVTWLTAPDNRRAQAVYDRVGGRSNPFLEYELDLA